MGVPNTLAKPALTPHATSRLRSSALSLSACPIPAATLAPMCEQGPSLPAEPPQPSVMSAATGLTQSVVMGMRPACSLTATMGSSFKSPRRFSHA